MTDRDDFLHQFEDFWDIAVADGDRAKDSQLTLTRLADFFRQLDDDEKGLVAEALCGWTSLSNERRRFAAYVLIDDFGLSMAEPAMRDRRAVRGFPSDRGELLIDWEPLGLAGP